MNKILKKYFEELAKYSDLNNPENDMPFSEVVGKIVLTKDPEAIPLLLKFFDDDMNCEYTSETLQNQIEYFAAEDYIPVLLKELKNMISKASEYCEYFLLAIFNTPYCLKILKKNIHLADKETMLKLLGNMEHDKYCPETHKPIIAELRKMVNN